MHPPLHSLLRKVISDCPVPSSVGAPAAEPSASTAFKKRHEATEYVIPKGEFVLAAPGYSQVDESIWGKDAKEFRVEGRQQGARRRGRGRGGLRVGQDLEGRQECL